MLVSGSLAGLDPYIYVPHARRIPYLGNGAGNVDMLVVDADSLGDPILHVLQRGNHIVIVKRLLVLPSGHSDVQGNRPALLDPIVHEVNDTNLLLTRLDRCFLQLLLQGIDHSPWRTEGSVGCQLTTDHDGNADSGHSSTPVPLGR